MLEQVEGLDRQMALGIRRARTAYDDPGALLMKLRIDEPRISPLRRRGREGWFPTSKTSGRASDLRPRTR